MLKHYSRSHTIKHFLSNIARDNSGLALVEFALGLPFMIVMMSSGIEIANYVVVQTRISSLAVMVADNASRIGEGNASVTRIITEAQINDLLLGAQLHAGRLNLTGTHKESGVNKGNGRIIISSLEAVANPNPTNRYNIRWQRCRGSATNFTPKYGVAGQASGTNIAGMGPAGQQVTTPADTPVMFVEVHYRYDPIFLDISSFNKYQDISSTSAMTVRNPRDLSQIYNDQNGDGTPDVAASSC